MESSKQRKLRRIKGESKEAIFMAQINIRVDDNLKQSAERTLDDIGLCLK